jgi:hypothetical protein
MKLLKLNYIKHNYPIVCFILLNLFICISIPAYANINNGLVGHYPLNGNANDSSNYGNNGTINSATATTDRFGNPSGALYFDGVDDYVQINTSSSLDTRYSISIFAWINYQGTTDGPIVQYGSDAWGVHFWTLATNNSLYIKPTQRSDTGQPGAVTYNNGCTGNAWKFVGGTYDYSTGIAKLYVDGVQVASLSVGQSEIGTQYLIRFGNVNFDARKFKGKIDDVRIYNRALSDDDVSQLYNESNPEINNALSFDGINDCVNLGTNIANYFSGRTAMTIEFWFKGSVFQSAVRIQDVTGQYIVAGWAPATPVHIISTDGATGGVSCGDVNVITDGNWHHLAMTWQKNTTNGFKSYLDGILVDQRNSANVNLPILTNDRTFLGSFTSIGEFINGQLDEVRIWDVVRTQSQIQENMNQTLIGNESGLFSYYSFDQDDGLILSDISGNGNDGTLTNMDTTAWINSFAKIHEHNGPAGIGGTNGLSDLKLWLHTDNLQGLSNGDPVSSWADTSGNNFLAEQPTTANQPQYLSNQLNGHGTISFSGYPNASPSSDYDYLNLGTQNFSPGTDLSIFIITKINTTGDQYFLGHFNGWSNYRFGNLIFQSNRNSVSQYNLDNTKPDEFTIINVNIDSSQAFVYWNGIQKGSTYTMSSSNFDQTNDFWIGCAENAGYYSLDGSISEIIIYGATLNQAQRTILNNYLSAKYAISISSDKYAGDDPAKGNYDNDVAGIGKESDGSQFSAQSAGFLLNNSNFLADNGDYLVVGHADSTSASFTNNQNDLPTGFTKRLTRIWYIDRTDGGASANGNIIIGFDFSEAGLPEYPNEPENYTLLYRSGTSGTFSGVSAITANTSGDCLYFEIDSNNISDGYYSLGWKPYPGSGYALAFDGTDDYVRLQQNYTWPTNFSILGWIYLEDYNFVASILSAGNVSGAANTAVVEFRIYEDKLQYLEGDGITSGNVSSSTTFVQNRWYHVALVKNDSTVTLYVNGKIEDTGTVSVNFLSNVDVALGEWLQNGTPQANYYYKGKMDEISFWSTPLSTNDIRANMCKRLIGNETGLLYYYRFDHHSGTILTDFSGNSNHGTLINMNNSDWVTSTVPIGDVSVYDYNDSSSNTLPGSGNALEFDGTNDHVIIPDNSLQNITNSFTIEFWFKSNNTTQSQTYVIGEPVNIWAILYEYVDDTIEFYSAGFTGSDPRPGTGMQISDQTWHHVAYTYDGSTWSGYLDGVQQFSVSRTFSLQTSTNGVYIGSANGSLAFVQHTMDELRIWNLARTASQIQDNMNRKLTGSETGLVGYYRFDSTSGTTLYDSSGNNIHGSLTYMEEDDWISSGVPIYNVETSLTIQNWATITAAGSSGTINGIHLYGINEPPNITTTPSEWLSMDTSHYFGVFPAGSNQAYSVTFDYSTHSDITIEDTYKLAYRPDATSSWTDINATVNDSLQTLSKTEIPYTTASEFIFGFYSDPIDISMIDPQDISISNPIGFTVASNENGQITLTVSSSNQSIISDSNLSLSGSGTNTQVVNLTANISEQLTLNITSASSQHDLVIITLMAETSTGITSSTNISIIFSPPGPGNALSFDGTDDNVNLGTNIGNHFAGGSAITIEYWFKGSVFQSPVRFQDVPDTTNFIVAGFNQTQSNPIHIINTDGGADGISCGNHNYITDGRWHHLAMTWQRNTSFGFKSYLDGVLVDQRDSADVGLPLFTNERAFLGSYGNTGDFIKGQLDDVRIWDVARSQSQIQESMCQKLSGNESGLVAYYQFDHDSGTTLTDMSGNNHHGTLLNMDNSDWVLSGAPIGDTSISNYLALNGGYALTLDGVNEYVQVPINAPETNYTLELWFKTNVQTTGIASHRHPTLGGDSDRWLYLENGNIYHLIYNSETINSTGQNFADNQWHHVAVVVESGVGQKIYVDAVLVASGSKHTSDFNWDSSFDIGYSYNGYFNGSIDEVRLWNEVKTQAEIKKLMYSPLTGNESNLLLHYSFNQEPGTTITDLSGNGKTGNAVNFESEDWVLSTVPLMDYASFAPPFGEAGLHLDGVNEYIAVPFDPPETNYTYELWFKTSYQTIGISIVREATAYGGSDRNLYLTGGNICHRLWSEETICSTGQNFGDNTWHHVAVVVNSSSGQQLYVDGSLMASGTKVASDFNTARCLDIGYEYGLTSTYFKGNLFEVRLWNEVRTQAQIQNTMYEKLTGSETNLLVYFRFDQQYNSTVTDLSGNGNNGQPINIESTDWVQHPLFTASLSNADGDTLTASCESSSGIQMYLVNESPENLSVDDPAYALEADAYWGIFPIGNSGSYTVFYKDTETDIQDRISLFGRYNPSDLTWTNINATLDASTNTLTQTNLSAFYGVSTTELLMLIYKSPMFTQILDQPTAGTCSFSVTTLHSGPVTMTVLSSDQNLISYTGFVLRGSGTYTQKFTATENVSESLTLTLTPLAAQHGRVTITIIAEDSEGYTSSTDFFVIVSPDSGNALDFDGVDDYIDLPDGVWFNGDFTIESWIYLRSYTYWSKFVDFGSGSDADNIVITISDSTTGRPVFHIFNGASQSYFGCAEPFPLNQWAHLAVTLSGSVGKIYINGRMVATNSSMYQPLNVTRQNAYIAKSNWSGNPNVNMKIDEFRIWSVARTQSEIQQSMNQTLNGSETGLLTYYRFDHQSGTTVVDLSGNNLHGTLTNMDNDDWVSSIAPDFSLTDSPGSGKSLDFDGVDDYIDLSTGVWFNGDFTVESWIYLRNYGNFCRLIDVGAGSESGADNIIIALSDGTGGKPNFHIYNGATETYLTSQEQIPLNQWVHLAATSSGSDGYLYMNGRLVASNNSMYQALNVVRQNAYIGKSNWSTDAYSNMKIDEFRIWSVARTQSEIRQNMCQKLSGTETGLLLYYRFDHQPVSAVFDLSGNNLHGTLINMDSSDWLTSTAPIGDISVYDYNDDGSYAMPGSGRALSFDAVDDYVDLGSRSELILGNTFTIEAWIYSTVPNTNYFGFIGNQGGTNTDRSPSMWIYNQTQIHYDLYNESSTTCGDFSGNIISSNQWIHIALVHDGTTLNLYANGINQYTSTACSGFDLKDIPINFIGKVDNWFSGYIDEVRLWNIARNESQIQNSMNAKLTGNETGLVAYYRFDSTSGNTLYDSSGNDYHGTLMYMNNDDWISSNVPFFDPEVSLTINNWATIKSKGNDGLIKSIHLYAVNESPNITDNPSAWQSMDTSHYFGVFTEGSSQAYSITYDYSNHSDITTETVFKLAYRLDAADSTWTDINATLNESQCTLSKTNILYDTASEFAFGFFVSPPEIGIIENQSSTNTAIGFTVTNIISGQLTVTVTSSDSSIIPYTGLSLTASGNNTQVLTITAGVSENLTLSITPQANQHDCVTLTVMVSDSSGQTSSRDFTVIVSPPGPGNALSFDGSTEYVEVPYHDNLNTNVFTISVWAKVTGGTDTFRSVVTSRNPTFAGYMIYAADSNLWAFWLGNGSEFLQINGDAVVLNQWTHLALTHDESDNRPSGLWYLEIFFDT